jgi:hypothetical protein
MKAPTIILAIGACWIAAAPSFSAEPVTLSQATRGYTYFNRPGADMAAHEVEVRACATEAARTLSVAAELGGTGLLFANARRASFVSAVENCMVVRGWRVVKIPEAEGEALAKRAPPEVAAWIAPWVGAESPRGEITRVWNNDAARASTVRFDPHPNRTHNGSLSIVALGNISLGRLIEWPQDLAQTPWTRLDRRWPRDAIKPDEFAAAPADAAIVIVQVTGLSFRGGVGVTLMRQGPEDGARPSTIDRAPDEMKVLVPLLVSRPEGNWRAFAVPAGRWRIASMHLLPQLDFCLGAPAFEVGAGEIVYAGSFDFAAENIGPDLSLERARTWLAGQPAAERVRAAQYTNGWTSPCSGNAIYALEVEGAPFKEGYAWGGALPRAAPTPADPVQPKTPSQE